jgi:mRNA-degrading endonuclease YafQ of YafQ-DinJ toxin-antitoxin module
MSYRVETTARFERQANRFFRKHRDLRSVFAQLVEDLMANPFEPRLRLHRLSGHLDEIYAVSLTYKYRVTLTLLVSDERITLLDIGSHDEVYRD